jgi:iron uptake system component EfeO
VSVRRSLSVVALAAALGLLAACSDDGGTVRSEGGGSASGIGSGSGAGAGSGLSPSDLDTGTGTASSKPADPAVTKAAEAYRRWVQTEVAGLRTDAKKFTDAVRAGDLAEAKKQYAPSRYKWETIEPIAALISDIDRAVDARVDDFASVNDPKWTGWHKLEYLLWLKNTTSGGAALADKLDKDLATLQVKVKTVDIPPKAVALGAGQLIEEVFDGKITGEEDRYSHTDLSDFDANRAGARRAYEFFAPIVQRNDRTLAAEIDRGFAAVEASLAPYETSEGVFKSFSALTPADKTTMKARLAALSEDLAKLPAALGLS